MADILWTKYNCTRKSKTGYTYTESEWKWEGTPPGDSVTGYTSYAKASGGSIYYYVPAGSQKTVSRKNLGTVYQIDSSDSTIVYKIMYYDNQGTIEAEVYKRTISTSSYIYYAYEIGDKIGAVTAAEGAYPEADQGYIYVTTSNGYTIMKNGNTYYAYLNAGAVPGYIYIGVNKEFPVYEKNFNINIDNITECFTVENGETYYFAGLGNVFTSNNSG